MSPNWFVYSLFLGILFGLMIFAAMWLLLGDFDAYIVGYCALMGFAAFMVKFWWTWGYRDKIIADMEAAKPLNGTYGFRGYTTNFGVEHVTIVPTMAGDLKFISLESISNIQKKAGQLFNYYVFNEVENLDQKDLSKFVAIDDDLG